MHASGGYAGEGSLNGTARLEGAGRSVAEIMGGADGGAKHGFEEGPPHVAAQRSHAAPMPGANELARQRRTARKEVVAEVTVQHGATTVLAGDAVNGFRQLNERV